MAKFFLFNEKKSEAPEIVAGYPSEAIPVIHHILGRVILIVESKGCFTDFSLRPKSIHKPVILLHFLPKVYS